MLHICSTLLVTTLHGSRHLTTSGDSSSGQTYMQATVHRYIYYVFGTLERLLAYSAPKLYFCPGTTPVTLTQHVLADIQLMYGVMSAPVIYNNNTLR